MRTMFSVARAFAAISLILGAVFLAPRSVVGGGDGGWTLGEVIIVAQDLPGGGVTSMVGDCNYLYFNIYGGPLEKVAHTGTTVSTALPQDPGWNDRYEMQCDAKFLYWSNRLMGGGNPGQVRKTSLSSLQDVWTIASLNEPKELQIANGYLYFINDKQEVLRIPLAGKSSELIYADLTATLNALAVDTNGNIYFGHCPECPGTLRSVVSVLRAGETTPVDLIYRDGGRVSHMQIYNNKLYVLDEDLIYSLDLIDGTIKQLIDIGATSYSFSLDDDGIYYTTAWSAFAIYAFSLDGSHMASIGTGPVFWKQGNLIYWYSQNDRILRRRTLVRKFAQTTPTKLVISGPDSVNENSSVSYTATATFSDNRTQKLTCLASWSEDSNYAVISGGTLTTAEVTTDQPAIVTASWSSGGVSLSSSKNVTIVDTTRRKPLPWLQLLLGE